MDCAYQDCIGVICMISHNIEHYMNSITQVHICVSSIFKHDLGARSTAFDVAMTSTIFITTICFCLSNDSCRNFIVYFCIQHFA